MSANICLECRKGADECCFMARLAPVDGWEAKKVRYRVQGGRCSATYRVKACPNFEAAQTAERKRYETKICARCGRGFVPHTPTQKYCRRFCAVMAEETM